MTNTPRILLALLLLLGGSHWAFAQRLVPLQAARTTDGDIQAPFPFYDDFSTASGFPDTLLWEPSGGAYANFSYGIGSPTLGVATLDGLDSTGTPYVFNAPSALGLADRLTSRPIDLSGLALSDAPTLSFFWQARGWGEQPNADDSLLLQFRHPNGTWVRQWGVSADSLTPFSEVAVRIAQAIYLYDGFQFRFINYGRLSGPYDTWNIDYVYFNTPANANTPNAGIVRDIGFSGTPPQLLKGYTQMPWAAFREQGQWADTLRTSLRNVQTGGPGDNVTHFFSTEIFADGTLVHTATVPASSIDSDGIPSVNGSTFLRRDSTIGVEALVSLPIGIVGDAQEVRIEQRFFLFENSEDQNAVPTERNDTVRISTVLGQAFAYDDGSAEVGWGINKKFGKFAVEFETPIDWRMDAVDLYIARVGRQLTQGGFRIGIWQHIDTLDAANDVVLSPLQYYPIAYTDSINALQRFPLGATVNVPAGKFYVVIEQLTDELLPIGFDLQQDAGDKLYLNLSDTRWRQNAAFSGSLLVRPVNTSNLVTALPKPYALDAVVFPNPTAGTLQWSVPVERAEAYDLQGRQVAIWEEGQGPAMLSLAHLPKGVYVVRLLKQGAMAVKKVVLE